MARSHCDSRLSSEELDPRFMEQIRVLFQSVNRHGLVHAQINLIIVVIAE